MHTDKLNITITSRTSRNILIVSYANFLIPRSAEDMLTNATASKPKMANSKGSIYPTDNECTENRMMKAGSYRSMSSTIGDNSYTWQRD